MKHSARSTTGNDQYFHTMLNALPSAIYATDMDGRITFCNNAAIKLCGRPPNYDRDRWHFFEQLYDSYGIPLSLDDYPLAQMLTGGRQAKDAIEVIGERSDGSRVLLQPSPSPLFDASNNLIGGVNTLIDVTERHKADLESAHLAAIISSSRDAIISKGLDGTVRSWNAAATEIFGYDAAEMIGQPITRIIPPDHLGEEADIMRRLRRGERIEHFDTERVGKHNRAVTISLTVSPVRDRNGRIIGASKIARDITERKKAEELRHLLIRELNHRVKNTLGTVQSIANQTARIAQTPAAFSASFGERIQTIAQTHDLLAQHSWQGADLLTILRSRLLLSPSEAERVRFSGPEVFLEPQPALHLALVLHELSTNARKYGSLSVPDGTLSVAWSAQTKERRMIHLRWEERGGPAVSQPSSRGFGTTLITRTLAAHNGAVLLQYEPAGLICEIELPLGEAPQSDITTLPSNKTTTQPNHKGSSLRVLVVEDEAAIAMDLISGLTEMGCSVIGPAATLDQATQLIQTQSFDIALLDANLHGKPVDTLATALTEKGIPFAFLSGYGRDELPAAFYDTELVRKPFTFDQVNGAIRQLARSRPQMQNLETE